MQHTHTHTVHTEDITSHTITKCETQVDPYLKLLPMLMGIGSPGTVQEVKGSYMFVKLVPSACLSPPLLTCAPLAALHRQTYTKYAQVLRGYVGDRSAEPVLDGALGKAFNILGEGYQVCMLVLLIVCVVVTVVVTVCCVFAFVFPSFCVLKKSNRS